MNIENRFIKILVHGGSKEKPPTALVLTTLSDATEATIDAIKVESSTTEIEIQETCDVESRTLNKKIASDIKYKDVHSINYIIDLHVSVVKVTSYAEN